MAQRGAPSLGTPGIPGTSVESGISGGGATDRVDSLRGWVVVAATVIATTAMFGVVYSFGSFFGAMADTFGASRSATA